MTQTARLLVLLQVRGSEGVTPLEALDAIGSFRLAGRIYELRQAGHTIRREWHETANGARVARYVLVPARRVDRVAESPGLGL